MTAKAHSITVVKSESPWDGTLYGIRSGVWHAECSCGWVSEEHRELDWKHPDMRALDDGEQHLMHTCATCLAINQACSPKATRFMGKPPGTHELHDDVRFWCPIHTAMPRPKRPPVQRMRFRRETRQTSVRQSA